MVRMSQSWLYDSRHKHRILLCDVLYQQTNQQQTHRSFQSGHIMEHSSLSPSLRPWRLSSIHFLGHFLSSHLPSLSLSTSRNVFRSLFMYIMQPLPSSHYLSLYTSWNISLALSISHFYLSHGRWFSPSVVLAQGGRDTLTVHRLWPIKSISQEKEEVFMSSGDRLY